MRKFILALPLLLAASCTTTGMTPAQFDALVAQVQAYTTAACSFQPTAASVAALISALYPAATPAVIVAGVVGEAICRAPVTAATVRRRGVTVVTRVVQTPRGLVRVQGVRR